MTLTLCSTGLASPAYEHLEDWTIFEDGREVGRMYEDGSASTPPELKWSWPSWSTLDRGIVTSGKAPTLEHAKRAFRRSWATSRLNPYAGGCGREEGRGVSAKNSSLLGCVPV
jgi:hypothetical protein